MLNIFVSFLIGWGQAYLIWNNISHPSILKDNTILLWLKPIVKAEAKKNSNPLIFLLNFLHRMDYIFKVTAYNRYLMDYTASSSLVLYGGGNKLPMLAKISSRPGGAFANDESKTESGIATRVSSRNDFIVCMIQEFH
jgi:hypothetical protein